MYGCIHVYYGDGKGKTTAAMGQVLRCIGNGGSVLVMQFLKGDSGERHVLSELSNVTLWETYPQVKFTAKMTRCERQEAADWYTAQFRKICEVLSSAHGYQMLLLDEIFAAISSGLVPEELVLTFLRHRPEGVEILLTGRNPSDSILELADYATELVKRKHPFDKGIKARPGIEY